MLYFWTCLDNELFDISNVRMVFHWKFGRKWLRFISIVIVMTIICIMHLVSKAGFEQQIPSVVMFDPEIYQRRKLQAEGLCGSQPIGKVEQVYLHSDSKLAYCPVAKIGSTFWKRVYLFLNNETGIHNVNSPFLIPRDFVHYGLKVRTQILKMNASTEEIITNGKYTRFMFVRDPYARLWSTYLDKFYLPDFWRSYAKGIVKKRELPSEEAEMCCNDVTFLEFLKYVTSLIPQNMNEHWQPIKNRCDPCKFKPDVIGKQESFAEDSRYVLRGIDQEWIMDSQRHQDHGEEEIRMLIQYNFKLLKSKFIKNCTDGFDIARRLWGVFQLNGYLPISESVDSFLNKSSKSHVKEGQFRLHVLKTHRKYPERERKGWKQYRRKAMEAAYSTIPRSVIEKIHILYKDDFESFGYDKEPPSSLKTT